MGHDLDYDQTVVLDGESLAEAGIGEAYEEVLPRLREFVSQPAQVDEVEDSALGTYSVRSQGILYAIYGPDLPDAEGQAWGRATFAFFDIINRQLRSSSHRFYAINSGNDLGGMFLTEAECESAKRSLPQKYWPYIPVDQAPWFGFPH